jgi:glycogen synthase
MRILMLGWEFPPFISGGLGTACYGLACAMENLELDVVMLLPTNTLSVDAKSTESAGDTMTHSNLTHFIFKKIPYRLPNPYNYSKSHSLCVFGTGQAGGYDGNLIDRVYEYAKRCVALVKATDFDVIHAHDWVTFPAAMALSKSLNKPIILHVHATEIDRSGEYINRYIYDIEKEGMEAASAVITVSHFTADILSNRYGVPFDKIHVIHNGINPKEVVHKKPIENGEAKRF